jgi:hypothetical protein
MQEVAYPIIFVVMWVMVPVVARIVTMQQFRNGINESAMRYREMFERQAHGAAVAAAALKAQGNQGQETNGSRIDPDTFGRPVELGKSGSDPGGADLVTMRVQVDTLKRYTIETPPTMYAAVKGDDPVYTTGTMAASSDGYGLYTACKWMFVTNIIVMGVAFIAAGCLSDENNMTNAYRVVAVGAFIVIVAALVIWNNYLRADSAASKTYYTQTSSTSDSGDSKTDAKGTVLWAVPTLNIVDTDTPYTLYTAYHCVVTATPTGTSSEFTNVSVFVIPQDAEQENFIMSNGTTENVQLSDYFTTGDDNEPKNSLCSLYSPSKTFTSAGATDANLFKFTPSADTLQLLLTTSLPFYRMILGIVILLAVVTCAQFLYFASNALAIKVVAKKFQQDYNAAPNKVSFVCSCATCWVCLLLAGGLTSFLVVEKHTANVDTKMYVPTLSAGKATIQKINNVAGSADGSVPHTFAECLFPLTNSFSAYLTDKSTVACAMDPPIREGAQCSSSTSPGIQAFLGMLSSAFANSLALTIACMGAGFAAYLHDSSGLIAANAPGLIVFLLVYFTACNFAYELMSEPLALSVIDLDSYSEVDGGPLCATTGTTAGATTGTTAGATTSATLSYVLPHNIQSTIPYDLGMLLLNAVYNVVVLTPFFYVLFLDAPYVFAIGMVSLIAVQLSQAIPRLSQSQTASCAPVPVATSSPSGGLVSVLGGTLFKYMDYVLLSTSGSDKGTYDELLYKQSGYFAMGQRLRFAVGLVYGFTLAGFLLVLCWDCTHLTAETAADTLIRAHARYTSYTLGTYDLCQGIIGFSTLRDIPDWDWKSVYGQLIGTFIWWAGIFSIVAWVPVNTISHGTGSGGWAQQLTMGPNFGAGSPPPAQGAVTPERVRTNQYMFTLYTYMLVLMSYIAYTCMLSWSMLSPDTSSPDRVLGLVLSLSFLGGIGGLIALIYAITSANAAARQLYGKKDGATIFATTQYIFIFLAIGMRIFAHVIEARRTS